MRTSVLVEKFNSGAIETSSGDPKHPPDAVRREIALRRIKQELIDGYFGQSANDPRVPGWLERDAARMDQAGAEQHWFYRRVVEWLCYRGKTAHVACESQPAPTEARAASSQQEAQQKLTQDLAQLVKLPADAATQLCPGAKLEPSVVANFADTIRYRLALRRAVEGAALLVDEGRVSKDELELSAKLAFEQAAKYLRNRRWQRQLERPTVGLVVKGGATTGIFSAGAVWVALNIDYACSRDPKCKERRFPPRFEIMSGTSTGALVSTAVDIYNVSRCDDQRRERLELFQRWFVCSTSKDLFCTTTGTFGDLLAGDQLSLLEFDGIQRLLRSGVEPQTLSNESELLLNVVDFRTGRLDAFSDQDPSELTLPEQVTSAAMASAALPLIVKPEPHLPGEPALPGKFSYLDGGIRSELPIAAAVRRGAERLLIVSSAPSVVGESSGQDNGLDVAVRFIDVVIGGVLESEIDWAPRLAEGRRFAEFIECSSEYAQQAQTLCPDDKCDPVALCSGDWSKVCIDQPRSSAAAFEAMRNASDLLAPVWRTTSIYRDEARVPGLPGYLLQRSEQRKLFLAGAEEARQRCFEIAALLGLPAEVEGDPDWRRKLLRWCSPTPMSLDACEQPEDQNPRFCSDRLEPLGHVLKAQCKEGTP
ncbi:MAG TPA: patatin-like phospholipase family protein [Polyangiales bacterium]|nr:patatin-like phospholipase family protein [Polyangiales bacterium]